MIVKSLALTALTALLVAPGVVQAQGVEPQAPATTPGDARMNCGAIAAEAERLRGLVPPEVANAPQPPPVQPDFKGKTPEQIYEALHAPKPVTNAGKYNARLTQLTVMFQRKDCSGGGG